MKLQEQGKQANQRKILVIILIEQDLVMVLGVASRTNVLTFHLLIYLFLYFLISCDEISCIGYQVLTIGIIDHTNDFFQVGCVCSLGNLANTNVFTRNSTTKFRAF